MNTLTGRYLARHGSYFLLALACLAGHLCWRTMHLPSASPRNRWSFPPTRWARRPASHVLHERVVPGCSETHLSVRLQDHLIHDRVDKTYTALNLENEFVKLVRAAGNRRTLFTATDKTNQYDFFYQQHVIKPALIGMLGAWISGGVEWCAFHHHRNTTFMPVDYTLVENADGSKTIWFGETERRHRMSWLIGLTLYPDRSYVEATIKFFNRTAQPNSILYWANVAVHVNDDYQVIFPPDVQVATYHSKIDFTYWPIAQGKLSRPRLHRQGHQLVEELARVQFLFRLGSARRFHGWL